MEKQNAHQFGSARRFMAAALAAIVGVAYGGASSASVSSQPRGGDSAKPNRVYSSLGKRLSNLAPPIVAGAPIVGQTLTASNGTWSVTPTRYTYSWSDCSSLAKACTAIAGATSSSYGIATSDVGHTIRVAVTAWSTSANSTATSASTAVVTTAPNGSATAPASTAAPTVSGTVVVGQILAATPGSWSGTTPMTYSYQWQDCDPTGANCAAVAGATASKYTLAATDAGKTVRVAVTASNGVGSASATSVPTATVAAASVAQVGFGFYDVSIQNAMWSPPPTMAEINAKQSELGRGIDTVSWYANINDDFSYESAWINAILGSGRKPLVTFEIWDGNPSNRAYDLTQVIAGSWDARINAFAHVLATIQGAVYVRPFHEMNGDWYPWGLGVNGNTPTQFVQAWRHVHDLFVAAGATNVRFVWSPNVEWNATMSNLAQYWPGPAYVDVLAMDGYNGGSGSFTGWSTFEQVFDQTYTDLTALDPNLPVWVAETASSPNAPAGTSKAAWISDMWNVAASRYPRLREIVWFSVDMSQQGQQNWLADDTPADAAAFASN
jgi:beta-mannanase